MAGKWTPQDATWEPEGADGGYAAPSGPGSVPEGVGPRPPVPVPPGSPRGSRRLRRPRTVPVLLAVLLVLILAITGVVVWKLVTDPPGREAGVVDPTDPAYIDHPGPPCEPDEDPAARGCRSGEDTAAITHPEIGEAAQGLLMAKMRSGDDAGFGHVTDALIVALADWAEEHPDADSIPHEDFRIRASLNPEAGEPPVAFACRLGGYSPYVEQQNPAYDPREANWECRGEEYRQLWFDGNAMIRPVEADLPLVPPHQTLTGMDPDWRERVIVYRDDIAGRPERAAAIPELAGQTGDR